MSGGGKWDHALEHVARWPLLLGAAVCFTAALFLAPDQQLADLAFGAVVLGAVLLGSWVALYSAGLAGRRPDRGDTPNTPPDSPHR